MLVTYLPFFILFMNNMLNILVQRALSTFFCFVLFCLPLLQDDFLEGELLGQGVLINTAKLLFRKMLRLSF